jgi:hypothetical protein
MENQNVNIEEKTSEELALMLSDEHKKLFQTSQNILIIENLLRGRMPKVSMETSPNAEITENKNGPQ